MKVETKCDHSFRAMTMLSDFLDSVKETLMPTIHADEGEKDEGGEQGDSDDSGEQEASEDGEEQEGGGEDAEEEEEEEPVDRECPASLLLRSVAAYDAPML